MIYVKENNNNTWQVHAYAPGTTIPNNAQQLSKNDYIKLIEGTHIFDQNGNIIEHSVPAMQLDIKLEAARRIKTVAVEYTQQEQQTWPEQVQEAVEYLADPQNAVTPLLGARASARKITVEQMAKKVLEKRNQHKQAVGTILAAQDKLLAMNPIPKNYRDDKYWK